MAAERKYLAELHDFRSDVQPGNVDGWMQIKSSFYEDLLKDHGRLRASNAALLLALRGAMIIFRGLNTAYPGEFENILESTKQVIAQAEEKQP